MKTKNKGKKYCDNCKNGAPMQFQLNIGGQRIVLCITCWIGVCMGLKRDLESFEKDEELFYRSVRATTERIKNKEKI